METRGAVRRRKTSQQVVAEPVPKSSGIMNQLVLIKIIKFLML